MRENEHWQHSSTWPPSAAVRQFTMASIAPVLLAGQCVALPVSGAALSKNARQFEGWPVQRALPLLCRARFEAQPVQRALGGAD